MPELAEVAYYCKQWKAGLNAAIQRVACHGSSRVFRNTDPQGISHLSHCTLVSARTHGKQMLFGFHPGGWLRVHLGMTGRLDLRAPGHVPDQHDHLVLFQESQALVFRDPRKFGQIQYFSGKDMPALWSQLPPEVLSRKFTRARMRSLLNRHRRAPIKALLLNQEGFPGIGNWMADEVLWRIRLHPATLAGQLSSDESDQMWKALKVLCRQALEIIGEDWQDPPQNWLFQHRWRNGGQCPRAKCRQPLVRESLRGRTTCWCPGCQPGENLPS